jgi:hypothetical protein
MIAPQFADGGLGGLSLAAAALAATAAGTVTDSSGLTVASS